MDQPVNYLSSLNQNMSNAPPLTESPDIYMEIEEYLNQKMLKWFECSVEVGKQYKNLLNNICLDLKHLDYFEFIYIYSCLYNIQFKIPLDF